jgi:hypothetical protein
MKYKLPRSHKTKSEDFYRAEEMGFLKKKYHGKIPYHIYSREGSKLVFHTGQKIHTQGKLVEYKNKLAVVYKVEPNGVYLLRLKEGQLGETEKKPIFVKEFDYQEHTYPVELPFFSSLGLISASEVNYKKKK